MNMPLLDPQAQAGFGVADSVANDAAHEVIDESIKQSHYAVISNMLRKLTKYKEPQ